MREILFRGKRKSDGEWVYGCYYKQSEFYGDKVDDHIIITSAEDLSYEQALEYHEVAPETVGQFTGLLDTNGRKIFEGDIARYSEHYCYTPRSGAGGNIKLKNFEIIGNIHDNPELIGGGEDGN